MNLTQTRYEVEIYEWIAKRKKLKELCGKENIIHSNKKFE